MKVLLVEDDAGDALLVEDLLDTAGAGLTTVRVSSLSEVTGALSRRDGMHPLRPGVARQRRAGRFA